MDSHLHVQQALLQFAFADLALALRALSLTDYHIRISFSLEKKTCLATDNLKLV